MGAPKLIPLQEARHVLATHRPTEDGLCRGCDELWGRWAWYPCTAVSWAAAVEGYAPTPETCAVLGLQAVAPTDAANHRQAS